MTAASDHRCSYCGLPVPKPLFGGARNAEPVPEERYCCTGCRIAAALTQDSGEAGAATWTMTSLGLSVFFSMSVMVFTVAHWMYGAYDVENSGAAELSNAFGQILQWLAMMFSIPVVLLLGRPLVEDSLSNLRAGVWTSDLLLLTGVVASFAFSLTSVVRGTGPVYFETGCVILLAVTFGRWLSANCKLRTNAALDELERLLPETTVVSRDGAWCTLPLDDLRAGDVVLVQAGQRFPIDGQVLAGTAAVDEQVFTGESAPVTRGPDQTVFAGTLNLDGTLQVRATCGPRGGAFGALLDAVQKARLSKGAYQILADRVSAWFFPVIAALAIGTFLVHGLRTGWSEGLLTSLAVVLIACPCALALATPLAVWAAMGRAARQGILFRSGETLERLANVDAIRFDKTGTLTTGSPRVDDVRIADDCSHREFALRARSLAEQSSHLFSRAIYRLLRRHDVGTQIGEVRTVSGQGLEAFLSGEPLPTRLGRWDWIVGAGDVAPERLRQAYEQAEQTTQSIVALSWGGKVQGIFCLVEELRPEAIEVIHSLQSNRINLGVLSGDRCEAAARLAEQLHIEAQGELTPAEKADEIRRLQATGAVVAMVGDGMNDAPALTAAEIGIAMGCGTDVTRASAEVCLLRNDLRTLLESIAISRECIACVRGNLAWSFAYNGVGVVAASFGLLHPSLAAILMVVSSLVVLSRSMRLGQERGRGADSPVLADGSGVETGAATILKNDRIVAGTLEPSGQRR